MPGRASTYAPAIANCVAVPSSAEFRVAFSSGTPALQTEIVSPLPGVAPQMLAYGGSAVATQRSGRGYAIRDAFRNQLTTYDSDGTVTVVPLSFDGSGVAVSP